MVQSLWRGVAETKCISSFIYLLDDHDHEVQRTQPVFMHIREYIYIYMHSACIRKRFIFIATHHHPRATLEKPAISTRNPMPCRARRSRSSDWLRARALRLGQARAAFRQRSRASHVYSGRYSLFMQTGDGEPATRLTTHNLSQFRDAPRGCCAKYIHRSAPRTRIIRKDQPFEIICFRALGWRWCSGSMKNLC